MLVNIVFLLLLADRGLAQDLSGRFRFLYQSFDEDGKDYYAFTQSYNLRFNQQVNPLIAYLISVRYEAGKISETPETPGSENRLLEPRLEVILSNEIFDLTAGYRYTKTERGETIDQGRENIYSRLFLHRENFPAASLQFDRINVDDRIQNDTNETRLLANASYDIRDFSIFYNFEKKVDETKNVNFKRDGNLNSVNIQYQRSFFEEKLNVTGGYFISDNRIKTKSRIGVPFYVEKKPKKGLFSTDDTPLTGSLSEQASLIDRDTVSSTGIEIGGTIHGGGINRNIGLEYDPPQRIDTFFLFVSAAISPLSEDDFSWDIYTSDDNLNWVRVIASVPFAFNYTLNRFEFSFSALQPRFVKLVNTGYSVNEGPIAVTELQAYTTEVLVGRWKEEEKIQNINLNANWTPNERYSLTYGSFISNSDIEREHELSEYNLRDNNLTFFFRPVSSFSTTTGYSLVERKGNFQQDERDTNYFMTLNANFLEAIDLSLGWRNRSVERQAQPGLDVESYLFRVASQLYRDLNASLDIGYVDQKDFQSDIRVKTKSLRFSFYTRPREEIILSSDFTREFITQIDMSGMESDWSQTNLGFDCTFRPSSLLNFYARLLYQDLITISGWSKIYKMDWLPFPGGSIQLSMSYEKDVRELSGEIRDQARGSVRWNLRRNAYLDLSYYLINLRNEIDKRNKVLTALLEIKF
ncbi:MAG: hypothetical protein AB1756_08410 [Acidobacteriota bacterium]